MRRGILNFGFVIPDFGTNSLFELVYEKNLYSTSELALEVNQ